MSKTITSAEYNAWLEHPLTKGLKRSFQQSITDPENQPSQYGTVKLEMYEALEDQLAAEQLNNKRLRDALQEYIDEHEECQDADDWMAMMCSMEAHHTADEALSQPSDTSALDTYVAEKVKDAKAEVLDQVRHFKRVREQRDLAIEAVPTFVAEFARFVGGDGEFWLHELEDFLDTWKKMQDYTIKGSEKT